MYQFDYCNNCNHLFTFYETRCNNCNINRFKDLSENKSIDKKMKNFFLCAKLGDIQQSYFSGKK